MILFIGDEGSRNYVCEEDPYPTAPTARAGSYAVEAYQVFIERVVIYALEGTHWFRN